MASLIDTLTETLNGENEAYQKLLKLSYQKTDVIVKGDLDNLTKITDEEQEIVDVINALENTRIDTMNRIAKVLNTDVKNLKLEVLVSLLGKTPKEQKELAAIHDKLKLTLAEMKLINERNSQLLQESIDMVNFNMNLVQSMRKAPETANYNRGAYSAGSYLGNNSGGFDAKQ